MSASLDFREAIKAIGMQPPTVIIPGKWHRFPGIGKSKSNKSGYCKLFLDGLGGTFGDWPSGYTETWQAKRDRPYSVAERDAFNQHVSEAKAQAEAELIARQASAAATATATWDAAQPTTDDHPYLIGKGIKACGLKSHKGELVIPVRDGHTMHSLQFIDKGGKKRFLTGGRVKGCRYVIGDILSAAKVCIAEGFATGATIHEVTGCPVAIAFNAGNLEPVALALREELPDTILIVCADDDTATEGNPGLTKAKAAAQLVNGHLAIPDFGGERPDGMTDFNDMAALRGMEAVKHAIASAEKVNTDSLIEVGPLEGIKPTLIDRIPGVLGQVEDYYNATCVVRQPAFAAVASIALGSVALGRLYVARATRDSYSGLYLCEVVGTGGGKEHARTVVEEFLSAADLGSLIGSAGYTSAAAVFSALLHQPSHFAFIDELGRHLAAAKRSGDSHQQQVITELLKLWGSLGSPYRYRSYATMGLHENQKTELRRVILAPSITLLGASTPAALLDAVGNAGIEDGFLNRLLCFFGDETARADAFDTDSDRASISLPTDVLAWLKEVQLMETKEHKGNLSHFLNRDPEVKPEPVVLIYDRQALGVMRDLQADVEKRKNVASQSGTAELYMRTAEKATRLALIAAVSDRSTEIKANHAEWAARRAIACDSALERAAEGNIAETNHGRLCNGIWRVINRRMPGGLSEGSLAGACRTYRDATIRDRREAIATLIADGRLATATKAGINGAKYHRYVTTERRDGLK